MVKIELSIWSEYTYCENIKACTDHKKGNKIEEGTVAGALSMEFNRAFHHGVLSHEHDGVAT